MGIFDGIFGNDGGPEEPSVHRYEHFPSDSYGPAYPVAVYQEDIMALKELIEAESSTPTLMEQTEFIEEIMEDILDEELIDKASGDDLSPFVSELVSTWKNQMDSDPSPVWFPVAGDWRLELYLHHCEVRDEQEEDDFQFPDSIGRVHALYSRCKAAQENDSKIAIVPKERIPGEEPEDSNS